MQKPGQSPSPKHRRLRRSLRKRRTPGAWWEEFPTDRKKSLSRISDSKPTESREVSQTNGKQFLLVSEKLFSNDPAKNSLSGRLSDEDGEKAYCTSSQHQNVSDAVTTQKNVNPQLRSSDFPIGLASPAEDKALNQIQSTVAWRTLDQNSRAPHSQLPPNANGPSSPDQTAALVSSTTAASHRQPSSAFFLTVTPSREGCDVAIENPSSRTEDNLNKSASFAQAKESGCVQNPSKAGCKQNQWKKRQTIFPCAKNVSTSHADHNQNYRNLDKNLEEKKDQRGQLDLLTSKILQTSQKRHETDGDLRKHEPKTRFSSAQPGLRVKATNAQAGCTQVETPLESRQFNSGGFKGGLKPNEGDSPRAMAPRKNKAKPASSSYTFSLRSCLSSQPSSLSMLKGPESRLTSEKATVAVSNKTRQEVLVTKKTALRYNLVAGHAGTVKVAISISLNLSTIGEIVILPRSATGPRRAISGDEFYIVKHGYVECEVGLTSVTLSTGDYLGVPEGQCFEMRNPTPSRCELFFFSPKSTKSYSYEH